MRFPSAGTRITRGVSRFLIGTASVAFSLSSLTSVSSAQTDYQDDYLYQSWALSQANGVDIQAEPAWQMLDGIAAQNADPVTVALVGTGVDINAPDLLGRIAPIGEGSFEDGFANMVDWNNDPNEIIFNHETVIAHQISALADDQNFIGAAGEFPVQILPVKVVNDWEEQLMDGALMPVFSTEGDYYYKSCESFADEVTGEVPETCLKLQLAKFFEELDAEDIDHLRANGGTVAIYTYYGVAVDLGVCGSFWLDLTGLHANVNDCYELITDLNEDELIDQLHRHWANTIRNPWIALHRLYYGVRYAARNGADVINVSSTLDNYAGQLAIFNRPPPVPTLAESVFRTRADGSQYLWSGYESLVNMVDGVYELTPEAIAEGFEIIAQGTPKALMDEVMTELLERDILMVTSAGNLCAPETNPADIGMPNSFAYTVEWSGGQAGLKYPNVLAAASLSTDGELATDLFTELTDSDRAILPFMYAGSAEDWAEPSHLYNYNGTCRKDRHTDDHASWGDAHLAAPGIAIYGPGFDVAAAKAKYGNWYNVFMAALPSLKAQETIGTNKGSSFASPLVSASLALGKLAAPSLSGLELRDKLLESVTPTDQLSNWKVAALEELPGELFGQSTPVIQVSFTPLLKPIRALAPADQAGTDWAQMDEDNWETGGYLNMAGFLEALGVDRNGFAHSEYPKAAFIAYDSGATEKYKIGLPGDVTIRSENGLELVVELQPSSAPVSQYDVLIDGELHASYLADSSGGFSLAGASTVNGIGFSTATSFGINCALDNIYSADQTCSTFSINFDVTDFNRTSASVQLVAIGDNEALLDYSGVQQIRLSHQYPFIIDRHEVWFLWALWVREWNVPFSPVDYYRSNSVTNGVEDWKSMWFGAGGVYYLQRPVVGGKYIACISGYHPLTARHKCSNILVR